MDGRMKKGREENETMAEDEGEDMWIEEEQRKPEKGDNKRGELLSLTRWSNKQVPSKWTFTLPSY